MRFQIFLSLTAFALPILSLPLQYTEASDLEARFDYGDKELYSRTYLDLEEREFEAEPIGLVRRSPQHNTPAHAAAAHAATHNMPAHTDTFHMPNGAVYTGAHVHQAVHDFHLHDPIPGGHRHGSAPAGTSDHPHKFGNHPNHSDGLSPFPNHGTGHNSNLHEFPLKASANGYHGGKPGAARIIMHHDPVSKAYTFAGVVGHPQKGSAHPGDHLRATHHT